MPAVAQIIEVAVPSPLYRSFDYKLPEGVSIPTPGTRVLVSFGRQRLVGIVLSHKTHSDFAGNKLKTIEEILDSRPVFDTHLLQLLNWAAHYYHHPIGETRRQTHDHQGVSLAADGIRVRSARHRHEACYPSATGSGALAGAATRHHAKRTTSTAIGTQSAGRKRLDRIQSR